MKRLLQFTGTDSWANLKEWLFKFSRGKAVGLRRSKKPKAGEIEQAVEAFELVATLCNAKVPWEVVEKSLDSFRRAIQVEDVAPWMDTD